MDIKGNRSLVGDQSINPLPQAVDMEQVVLGAFLIDDSVIPKVKDRLKSFMFYDERHQVISKVIYKLVETGNRVDIKIVSNKLREEGNLERAGGVHYLAFLSNMVNSAAHTYFHARVVIENFIKRELIYLLSMISKEALDGVTDVFDILAKMEQDLYKIGGSFIRQQHEEMKDLLPVAIELMEARRNMKDDLVGVPSGFTAVDRITSGFQPSDLIIFAARPGMGKTAFVISALRNAAVDFNIPVAIFSLEMSSTQLTHRLISVEAELSSEKIKTGKMEAHEWQQLIKRTEKLNKAPIYIDDTPGLTVLELRAKARRLTARHDVKMIVIDYLQLMVGEKGGHGSNREQEIASISRTLKTIAKELNIPIIALSQLSRNVEKRPGSNNRPQLSDLRESGSIEQDADMVMFLYRPEYYGITEDQVGVSLSGVAEVIFAKNRHGKVDSVFLKFIGHYTKFADLDNEFQPSLEEGSIKTIKRPSKGSCFDM